MKQQDKVGIVSDEESNPIAIRCRSHAELDSASHETLNHTDSHRYQGDKLAKILIQPF